MSDGAVDGIWWDDYDHWGTISGTKQLDDSYTHATGSGLWTIVAPNNIEVEDPNELNWNGCFNNVSGVTCLLHIGTWYLDTIHGHFWGDRTYHAS